MTTTAFRMDLTEEYAMVRSIRVVVANRPKLMRELILSMLSDEPGVEIVGEVADDAEIAERVQEVSPDLLVIALDEPSKRPELCDIPARPSEATHYSRGVAGELQRVLLGFVRHSIERDRSFGTRDPECSAEYRGHGGRGAGIEIERAKLQRGVLWIRNKR
ncbi:MAG TPA: hypothetical protein VKQ28_10830 [Candidatus Acidoferrum sp.]|nr:hypothetical protein [Candidatus Acidoferrum sp.]